jgi:HNH endonuclease
MSEMTKLHIVHGSVTQDKKELEQAAQKRSRIKRWIVPKAASIGDEVYVKVGSGLFACALIDAAPKRRVDWKNRYGAALNGVRLIEPPVSLSTISRRIPEFKWAQYPRSVTTPSSNVARRLRALIRQRSFSDDVASDVEEIFRGETGRTVRRALVDARLGQGQFRARVSARWNDQCAMTGCDISAVLRASHIKPWSKSSNNERLNAANGILLAAPIDALFDCGLISFAGNGKLLISSSVREQLKQFRLPSKLSRKLTMVERSFLAYHRRHVFCDAKELLN